MQAQKRAKKNGWQVLSRFERHLEITGLWEPASATQGAGLNDDRRITVEASCLACHGTKASRPAFIQQNDPDDKAFGMKKGDRRGLDTVHIPELEAAVAQAG